MSVLSSTEANKWLIPIRKVEAPSVRLIAFHWVGGNGFVYRPLKKDLPDNIEIYAMMLPGRLSRRKEKFVESVNDIVEQLSESMQALGFTGEGSGGQQPATVFFGHSYGGIIAYELAILLQRQDLLRVSHLVISSTNCPKVLTMRSTSTDDKFYKKFYQLSMEDLEHELIKQGALLGGVHIDILRASLPIIRADYKGLETYSLRSSSSSSPEGNDDVIYNEQTHSVFRGPMTVWGGAEDLHNVSEESLAGWREHQEAPDAGCDDDAFSCKIFPGSHFYFGESAAKEEFIAELSKICLASV